MRAGSEGGSGSGPGRRGGSPAWLRAVLRALVPSRYRADLLGDLEEGYARRVRSSGAAPARRWYARQVLGSVPGALALRMREWNANRERGHVMGAMLQDLRFGLRTMWRKPGFAVVATLTLALAIGVNTAIFSVVSQIVFIELPAEEPEGLMVIRSVHAASGEDDGSVSWPDYLDFRERLSSFRTLSALGGAEWVLTGREEPVRVSGLRVTHELLDSWGRTPVVGRGFLPEDDRPGAAPVALVSHGFWQGYLGGRDVVGETIRLDGDPVTIVGVLPESLQFLGMADAQVWVPMASPPSAVGRSERTLWVSGRLAEGVGVEAAKEEVARVGAALVDAHPEAHAGWSFIGLTAREDILNEDTDLVLLILSLSVGFVLLIACANVANMYLARSTDRERELAVRTAIGAGRGRLVRQLLTEALVVALVAGALGVGLAKALLEGLVWVSQGQEPAFRMAAIDGKTLLFTVAVSLLAPLLFALVPALRGSRSAPAGALKDGGARSGGGRGGGRTRSALVTAQVALAVMVMVVASLLARMVIHLQTQELGYQAEGVLSFRVNLPGDRYDEPEELRGFYDDLLRELRGLPSADGAALVSFRPAIDVGGRSPLELEGRPAPRPEDRPLVTAVVASAGYTGVMRMAVDRGRGFTADDDEDAPPVALLSRSTADRLFGEVDPVGARIRVGADPDAPWREVVGVVADVRSPRLDDRPDPFIYIPFDQAPRGRMAVMLRSAGDAATLADPARRAVRAVDPGLPIDDAMTMPALLHRSAAATNAVAGLFGTFALFALLMAAIGIYGVMSYAVTSRAREIGLRVALGARSRGVRLMILRQGGRMLAAGILVGLAGGLLLGRLLAGMLIGVSPIDPVTFIAVPLILAAVALAANYIPALRATRIEPMRVLRGE